jgi:hypothetical protein
MFQVGDLVTYIGGAQTQVVSAAFTEAGRVWLKLEGDTDGTWLASCFQRAA